jgi:hypothetical protein
VFRVEGSLSLRVRADTRQRLGRGEVPQADRHTGIRRYDQTAAYELSARNGYWD